MGCKRRRRSTDPVRNDRELTTYTNHGVLEQTTCIQIEHEDLVAPHTENQMSMNPVFKEYDKNLYKADRNFQKSLGKTLEKEEIDFDERDSESFHTSSGTLTCSYRSYSEDEGYSQNSPNENNVKKTGKYSLERQGNSLIHEQALMGSEQDEGNGLLPSTCCDINVELSKTPHNSKLDQLKLSNQIQNFPLISKSTTYFETKNTPDANLNPVKNTSSFNSNNETQELNTDLSKHGCVFYQSSAKFKNNPLFSIACEKGVKSAVNVKHSSEYKEHRNDICLKKSLDFHNDKVISMSVKNDKSPKCVDTKNDATSRSSPYKKAFSSKQSAKFYIDLNDSMLNRVNLSSVVNVEGDSQSTIMHCELSVLSETVKYQNTLSSNTPKTCSTVDKSLSSDSPDHNLVESEQTQQSRKKLNLSADFPCLPYPILPTESSNSQSKKQRRHSSKSEGAFIPRYEKRPLMDMNGVPISQKELVKTLTGLLINGLQELPKHPMEYKVEQNFQFDIESLEPLSC